MAQVVDKQEPSPDVVVDNQGTIALLRPLTSAGEEWLENNIGQDNGYQPVWPTVLVEHRYLAAIIDGMIGDGLVVEEM